MKRTVVFLVDTLQTGGAEKSLLEITRCFKKYQPVFVQLFDKSSELKPEFDAAGIRIINLGLPRSFRFNKLSKVTWQHIQGLNPVLIHATLFMSDMISRKLPLNDRIPLINSFVNNSYSRQRYQAEPLSIKIKLWCLQQWDAITTKPVTLFLSNSETIKLSNASALRLRQDAIKVIYRGRSSKPYTTITRQQVEELRTGLNLANKKVFLNVSRLIDRKGHLDLIKAFGLVYKHHHDCVLLIAGEGPFRKRLEQEVRALSLEDQIRFLGNRKDVPLLLKSVDYFVFPSHYEGLPGALIEAMFARVPVIASLIPENRECVADTMALFHGVGNVEELALQMQRAMKDEKWMERTEAAFDYAMEHFEISKIAQQYEELYDDLISKQKGDR